MPLARANCAILLLGLMGLLAMAAEPPENVAGVIVRFSGHEDAVYGVALSPDGNMLLTAGFDKNLRLWDVKTARELRTFGGPNGHQNLVLGVTFAPDGQTFASCSSDNTVKIWDVPQLRPYRQLPGDEVVTCMAQTADGKTVAAGDKSGTIKIWKGPGEKADLLLKGHKGPVTGLAFSPNGQQLLSGGDDHTLRAWNITTGEPLASVVAHSGAMSGMALTPNGATAVTVSIDGSLKSWQLPLAPPTRIQHPGAISAFALAADGSHFVTVGDKQLKISITDSGKEANVLTAGSAVSAVALSGDASTLAVATMDKSLAVLPAKTKELKRLAVLPAVARAVAYSPDRKSILVGLEDGTVRLFDAVSGKQTKSFTAHPGGVTGLSYHANGTQVFTGGQDKAVKLWDVTAEKTLRTFGTFADPVRALHVSNDNALVAAAAGKIVKIWTAADGKEVATLAHPGEVLSVALSADHGRLITGSADQLARIWDLSPVSQNRPPVELLAYAHEAGVVGVAYHTKKPNVVLTVGADKTVLIHSVSNVKTLQSAGIPIRAIAMHPNGQTLLTGGDDKDVKIWNIGAGIRERSITTTISRQSAVAVSRNGNLCAMAGADGTITLHSLADGAAIGSIKTQAGARSLGFHPNGTALLSCNDKSVTTWNIAFQPGSPLPAEFGKPLQTFTHPANVLSATYSNDGASMLSACEDRLARIWKVAADGPIRSLPHPNMVDVVAYDKNGSLLASAGHDGIVRLWDTAKGAQVRQINAHTQPQPQPVYTLAWSPDGKQIASGSLDRSIKVWDTTNGNLVREIKGFDEKAAPQGHRDGVFTLAWTGDGQTLISGSSDRCLKMWKASDGAFVREFINPNLPKSGGQPMGAHPGWIYQVRLTGDGRVISVGGALRGHGYIGVWNLSDGRLLAARELPSGPIYGVAVSPSSDTLILGCGPPNRQSSKADAILLQMPAAK